MEYKVNVEGEENIYGDFEDVIDDVQNRSSIEIDGDDLASWLPNMKLSEAVNLGDNITITRIK